MSRLLHQICAHIRVLSTGFVISRPNTRAVVADTDSKVSRKLSSCGCYMERWMKSMRTRYTHYIGYVGTNVVPVFFSTCLDMSVNGIEVSFTISLFNGLS
jgi:hypothetical protein